MHIRVSRHAARRARKRHIPLEVIKDVYSDPDYRQPGSTAKDREIRGREYDSQVIEIVVDLVDDVVVSVWATRIDR